ncbi:hypothetical protein [Streptomyces sp. LS1784]|uniref:hypothetical protein n=1 Tax=Streptomyces sp. LS1784 TaxID=2851533 RepID=UPI001CCB322B|nr:hypothetical protein [Streptomyces sp. LS1784]
MPDRRGRSAPDEVLDAGGAGPDGGRYLGDGRVLLGGQPQVRHHRAHLGRAGADQDHQQPREAAPAWSGSLSPLLLLEEEAISSWGVRQVVGEGAALVGGPGVSASVYIA